MSIDLRPAIQGLLVAGAAAVAYFSPGLASLAFGELPPTSSKADPAQIATLVRDLGSERFSAREAASDRLAQIGLPAFSALQEASRHSDREIRFRAERILTLIRKNDLERRLAAFAAGTSKADDELPAWSRFAKGYGDSETSRRLFVEMQRAEAELLAAVERDPRSAVEVLGRRLQERLVVPVRGVNLNVPSVSSGEISAYLFVAAEEDTPVSAGSMDMLLRLCRLSAFAEMLRSPKDAEVAKKMLGGVIRRCDAEASFQAMDMAINLELQEGLVPALKVLEQPNGKWNVSSAPMIQMALYCVVKLGDQSHVPAVEKLLDNQALITSSMARVIKDGQSTMVTKEMQVRDVALASLVMLTKQDMKDYYGPITSRGGTSLQNPFPVQDFGFDKDQPEKREAALQKWAEYKARQPKANHAGASPVAGPKDAPADAKKDKPDKSSP